MKWVTSTVAGPSPDASPDSLCRADLEEIVADLLAAANHHQAEVLVSYDAAGGYGHPDHVRCHLAAAKAATILQIPLCEFTEQRAEASQWFDVSDQPGGVVAAYRAYHTQLSVQGDAITHVGGQIDYVRYAGGLRWVRT
jgi:N-acetyl-1-D-myo-inositol-2-amino-2-deoxy-alpha-D-glucopyranoside deacetylase